VENVFSVARIKEKVPFNMALPRPLWQRVSKFTVTGIVAIEASPELWCQLPLGELILGHVGSAGLSGYFQKLHGFLP